jgi:hypothetical protein
VYRQSSIDRGPVLWLTVWNWGGLTAVGRDGTKIPGRETEV